MGGRGAVRPRMPFFGGGGIPFEPPHLQVAGPPVQVQVDVFDLSVLSEFVVDVLLRRLLVDAGDKKDPTLHRCGAAKFWGGVMANVGPPTTARGGKGGWGAEGSTAGVTQHTGRRGAAPHLQPHTEPTPPPSHPTSQPHTPSRYRCAPLTPHMSLYAPCAPSSTPYLSPVCYCSTVVAFPAP